MTKAPSAKPDDDAELLAGDGQLGPQQGHVGVDHAHEGSAYAADGVAHARRRGLPRSGARGSALRAARRSRAGRRPVGQNASVRVSLVSRSSGGGRTCPACAHPAYPSASRRDPRMEQERQGGPTSRPGPLGISSESHSGRGRLEAAHTAHAVHATMPPGGMPARSLGLGLVGDHGLGGEHHGRDGRGVLDRGARHLGRIDDALGDHVDVLAGEDVEADLVGLPLRLGAADVLEHDRAVAGRRWRPAS